MPINRVCFARAAVCRRHGADSVGIEACEELKATYRNIMMTHVGQEQPSASASIRILTDHWPSMVRALYISTTRMRMKSNGDAEEGIALKMLLAGGTLPSVSNLTEFERDATTTNLLAFRHTV